MAAPWKTSFKHGYALLLPKKIASKGEETGHRGLARFRVGTGGIWPYPCLFLEYKRQKRHFSVTLDKYWYA